MPKIIRVVNWEQYQHYKDRNPPWIKIYTRLIDGDSREFLGLRDEEKWQMCAIMLLASRQQNAIPNDAAWLKERLHLRSPLNLKALEATGMIEIQEVASADLASCQRDACIETETETETETDAPARRRASPNKGDLIGFKEFWEAYPRKDGKGAAEKVWATMNVEQRLSAQNGVVPFSEKWKTRAADERRFCPMPSTWLNQRRWEDEGFTEPKPAPPTPEEAAKAAEKEFWAQRKREREEAEKKEREAILRELRGGADA